MMPPVENQWPRRQTCHIDQPRLTEAVEALPLYVLILEQGNLIIFRQLRDQVQNESRLARPCRCTAQPRSLSCKIRLENKPRKPVTMVTGIGAMDELYTGCQEK